MNRESAPSAVTAKDLWIWAAAAAALALVLWLKLLSGLLAGLLVYELVHLLARYLRLGAIKRERAKPLAVALLTAVVVILTTAAIFGIAAGLRHGSDSLPALMKKLAEIIDSTRDQLPPALVASLPTDADDLRMALTGWLRQHAGTLGGAGLLAGRALAHILIGTVIGALLALQDVKPPHQRAPLPAMIGEHAARLSTAFRRVVFAQAWIAGINALFTAVYLWAILPLAGVHLPLTKTMVALTFFAGLIPILGNLVSNSVIVVVSLSSSLLVALASLAFLVTIHKLEYFLNARIIGSHIRARAWELLLAMTVMEAMFGLHGVIAAPIYYAYFKDELAAKSLV
jgi:predicted PurR-regulated permease PerM